MSGPTVIIIKGGLPPDHPDAMPTDQAAIERAVLEATARGEPIAIVGGLPPAARGDAFADRVALREALDAAVRAYTEAADVPLFLAASIAASMLAEQEWREGAETPEGHP
ncbi:MAG: hypothetical protein ACREFJ_04955 [Acetobacteraceae bacterium]